MPSDPNCVFCKIVAGALPAHVVYRSADWLAFLDIAPLSDGHVLLIPTSHYATLDQLDPRQAAELGPTLARLSRAVRQVSGAAGYNVLQNNGRLAGQVVEHVHFHVIPRAAADGLGYRWNPKSLDAARARELIEQLQAHLGA